MGFLASFIFLSLTAIVTVSGNHKAPQIQTVSGPIQGTISQYRGVNFLEYKGIPYAKAPIIENRFMPPTKPDPWVIPYDASEYGPRCMQQGNSTQKDQSEDCLYINVFVTEQSYYAHESLPVMVYIHGGGFVAGSGDLVDKLGPNPLVPLFNVVLVSFNYRLGPFGFLYPGADVVADIQSNLGFRDQIFALQWVQDNINQFAGDPSRVTIFGESAGSISVGLHILSPASGKLFINAIMESGASWGGQNQRDETIAVSKEVIENVGCNGVSDIFECLQKADADDLNKRIGHLIDPFHPISGDDILPYSTSQAIQGGSFNIDKNLLVGTEKNDGAVFLAIYDISLLVGNVTYDNAVNAVKFFTKNQSTDFFIDTYLKTHEHESSEELKKALWEFADDLTFKCPTYVFAGSIANASQDTAPAIYAYLHTQKPKTSTPICSKVPGLGPCHTDDLPFVFGAPFRNPELYDREDDELSGQMMEIWTTFASSFGNIPPQGPNEWPSLGLKQKGNYVMELNSKNVGVLHHDKLDFCIVNWANFLQVYDPNQSPDHIESIRTFEYHYLDHHIAGGKMNLSAILIFFLGASTFVCAKHLAPQIQTSYGPVQGSVSQYRGLNVLEYKGIPYAKAPIDKNRFLPPSEPDPWIIPIDGSEYGPPCIQQGNSTKQKNQSEDCLYINVFVNEKSFYGQEYLPVMVYIHGGGFLYGSGNLVDKLGPNPLAALNDIVLVSFNYRLGSLGFLFPGSDVVPDITSNAGFRDQIFALQWVQNNIGAFHGDSSRVTIFGESAGSMSVGIHLISTESGKLFNNAIMESGAVWHGEAQRNLTIDGSYQLIKDVGCAEKPNILDCLQTVDVKDLMKPIGLFGNPFQPIFGDDMLPYSTSQAIQQGSFNTGKNLLVGTEKNDGALFLSLYDVSLLTGKVTYDKAVDAVKFFTKNQSTEFFINYYLKPHEHGSSDELKQALWEFADDLIFKCPTYVIASSIANVTQEATPVIGAYIHTQKPKTSSPICMMIPNLGPCHADDLPFVFGAPFRNPELYDRTDDELSRQMMEIWTNFATSYGTLPPQGPTDWPTFGLTQKGNYVMELNSKNIGVLHHDKLDFCIVNWANFLQVYNPN
ncbi:uncharacterized protein LOC141851428 [Brevipalpus obovatus]|uniref:uncharacterized protein LOC141851428 n=1 Tax=Brevipalpus obovatus TaxID=246614 RepID=UPI003D9F0A2A